MATRVYDLWAADFAAEPRALALWRLAESTVFAWVRELRGVGRAGLLHAEQSPAGALARHLAHLPATGKSSAALRGTACGRCGKPISEHILDAVVPTAVKALVDHRRADSPLRMWWAESHRWALDRPKVNSDDEALLHDTLHHLSTHGPPEETSSPQLWDGDAVTIELAGRGLGPAGSVQVQGCASLSGRCSKCRQ